MTAYTGSVPDTEPARAWLTKAACRANGVDPDLFFPAPGDLRGINAAKGVCARCPVRRACLADALAEEGGRAKSNRFGVRGGKAPGQRYALYAATRKQRQREAA